MRVLNIHPQNPQARLIEQAIAALSAGQLIAYPTDSGYALGWSLGSVANAERARRRVFCERRSAVAGEDIIG